MDHPLKDKKKLLQELCKKHRVKRLMLFGSAARNLVEQPANDFDFLVEFQTMPPAKHSDAYFGLLSDLEKALQKPVDLVEPGSIRNPYFKKSIQVSQILLYEAA